MDMMNSWHFYQPVFFLAVTFFLVSNVKMPTTVADWMADPGRNGVKNVGATINTSCLIATPGTTS
jgi:hypothetical protein